MLALINKSVNFTFTSGCALKTEIFKSCKNDVASKNKPLCVIANTTKGKNVSFMENNTLWHYRSPQGEEYKLAIDELEKKDA